MKTNKGKLAKRSRLIKQDIDSKGRIKKSSHIIPISYEDTLCKCKKSRVVEVKSYEVQFREIRHEFNQFKRLAYTCIAVLIALLIMWR